MKPTLILAILILFTSCGERYSSKTPAKRTTSNKTPVSDNSQSVATQDVNKSKKKKQFGVVKYGGTKVFPRPVSRRYSGEIIATLQKGTKVQIIANASIGYHKMSKRRSKKTGKTYSVRVGGYIRIKYYKIISPVKGFVLRKHVNILK
ncbi:MAG: hypothetical protein OEZ36_07950 [Spirochaetota bacterium]|nr:hypothetical protein [Spirochaetota bacterium]